MQEAPRVGHGYWWPEHVNGRRPREVHRMAVAGLRSCRSPQTAAEFSGSMGAMTGGLDRRCSLAREPATPVTVVPRVLAAVVLPPQDCATPLVGGDIRGGPPVRPPLHGDLVTPPPRSVLMRVIWCLSGVVSILLARRVWLALAGDHPASGFDRFLAGSIAPLAAPFASFFGPSATPAVPRLDASTLVALMVYALAAWGLAGLVGLGRRQLR